MASIDARCSIKPVVTAAYAARYVVRRFMTFSSVPWTRRVVPMVLVELVLVVR